MRTLMTRTLTAPARRVFYSACGRAGRHGRKVSARRVLYALRARARRTLTTPRAESVPISWRSDRRTLRNEAVFGPLSGKLPFSVPLPEGPFSATLHGPFPCCSSSLRRAARPACVGLMRAARQGTGSPPRARPAGPHALRPGGSGPPRAGPALGVGPGWYRPGPDTARDTRKPARLLRAILPDSDR